MLKARSKHPLKDNHADVVLPQSKFIEPALYEVISMVERSLHYKQQALAAFQGIKRTFNKVNTKNIKETLTRIRLKAGVLARISSIMAHFPDNLVDSSGRNSTDTK